MTIEYNEVDFIARLRDRVARTNPFANPVIGLAGEGRSIAVIPIPGGSETVYFDGVKDVIQNVQIHAKHEDRAVAYNTLSKLYQELERLQELPSDNGSYDFSRIRTTSMPSLVVVDEKFYIYEITMAAELTIYTNDI